MNCRLGPSPEGNYIDVEISLLDYEIMCKQTIDSNFCDCEGVDSFNIINSKQSDFTLEEFYVTKTITKEVLVEPETLDFKNESN